VARSDPFNVFIDTQVFDSYSHDFAHPHFQQLAELVKAKKLRVFITTVTDREILAHTQNEAKDIHQHWTKFHHSVNRLKGVGVGRFDLLETVPPLEEFEKALKAKYESFKKACDIEILPISKVKPDPIFEAYFAGSL